VTEEWQQINFSLLAADGMFSWPASFSDDARFRIGLIQFSSPVFVTGNVVDRCLLRVKTFDFIIAYVSESADGFGRIEFELIFHKA
jgi:hypothetical protein